MFSIGGNTVLPPLDGVPWSRVVAKELAEGRERDGDVTVPGLVADGKLLPAVAVGKMAVERTAPVLRLATGENVKQHLGEQSA